MLCLSGFELFSRWVPLRHPQNRFLFAHPRRQENLKVPHLIRIHLFCFQLPLYSI